jgi:phthiocerol/phenolphthiocerol synthesis type-I polyketide synthase E
MSQNSSNASELSTIKRTLLALEKMQQKYEALEYRQHEPIAIIGMGCRFPGGVSDPDDYWKLLQEGVDAIKEVPDDRWNIDAYYHQDPDAPGKMDTRWGGFLDKVDTFDAYFFQISPREAEKMDPQQRLLLEVAWKALEHAGTSPDSLQESQSGVFIGIMNNDYAQIQQRALGLACIDSYQATGSEFSFVAGRLSYALGLRGPSMCVNTACSSSLVAVHLACQSLRARECRLALTGGVNLILAPDGHVASTKIRAMASDGRCKAFDAAADGYVRGEGCGIVVLKRLEDALADNDRILALICGSAVNHDGPSNGLTVPSGKAQQAVIRQALETAQIAPTQVDYVETHGTGTPLGDPIEVEALSAVMGQGRERANPLVIGSVKTNLGHLEAAAGIAGLCKVVLALQHKAIPAHLHFKQLNPHIVTENISLTIPTKTVPWMPDKKQCIAGVSAFGLSGMNAHLIVAEAPPVSAFTSETAWQLLPLSARTPVALETMISNLETYLRQHPDLALADVAYTLQVGRASLSTRAVMLCRDREDAMNALNDPQRMTTGISVPKNRPIAFLFPGVGDQYINMTHQLYICEPLFRQHIDACSLLLEPYVHCDLREILYLLTSDKQEEVQNHQEMSGNRLDLHRMLQEQNDPTAERLNQTSILHPIMFMIEYALAQLWMSWGLRPHAMLGYSLGEFVAACIAGVFSLEDALRLVAMRAQLIQECPPGAMLAVTLSEQQVQPFLNAQVSLSAINSTSMCTVAGSLGAIEELQQRLTREGIGVRRLQTTHAFHSPMMQGIVQPLLELLQTIELKAPRIPYISNITGTWVSVEQTTDPEYWARHLLEPVRFVSGIQELVKDPDLAYLEVGPGQLLKSFILQYFYERGEERTVVSTLPARYDRLPERTFILQTIGQLWLAGVAIEWSQLHTHAKRRKVALPTYPFEEQRYWVNIGNFVPSTNDASASSSARLVGAEVPMCGGQVSTESDVQEEESAFFEGQKIAIDDWFSTPIWQQSWLPSQQEVSQYLHEAHSWLIFKDEQGLGTRLGEALKTAGQLVTYVIMGNTFTQLSDEEYALNIANAQEYTKLLSILRNRERLPQQIIHLWQLAPSLLAESIQTRFATAQQRGFFSLLYFVQAIGNLGIEQQMQISLVSNQMQNVLGDDGIHPEQATVLGICRVLPLEYPYISCRSIDIIIPQPETTEENMLVRQLMMEACSSSQETVVAFRGKHRWHQTLASLPLSGTCDKPARVRQQGVYLITGGLGGLGLACAQYLAQAAPTRLVLLGRTPLPERTHWEHWLTTHDEQDTVSQRIHKVLAIESLGSEVMLVNADIAHLDQVSNAIKQIKEHFGTINGVIHAAGVPGAGLMQLKTPTMVSSVFSPKIQGILTLEKALQGICLDFVVLFSSSVSLIGGIGEVDYCAANAFLDAYAHYRQDTFTVAINWSVWQWDAWQDALTTASPDVQQWFKRLRERYGITFKEGMEALKRILASDVSQVVVLTQERHRALQGFSRAFLAEFEKVHYQQTEITHQRPSLVSAYSAPERDIERQITAIWQTTLCIKGIGIDDNFFELGGNSLLAIQVITRMNKQLCVQLPVISLYEEPTIRALATLVEKGHTADEATFAKNIERAQKRKQRQQKLNRGYKTLKTFS